MVVAISWCRKASGFATFETLQPESKILTVQTPGAYVKNKFRHLRRDRSTFCHYGSSLGTI